MGFTNFVRVLSPTKELSEDIETTNAVHKLTKEEIFKNPKKNEELIKLISKKDRDGFLKESEYKKYKKRIRDIEDEIISKADIVLSTINNSADDRLKHYYFHML